MDGAARAVARAAAHDVRRTPSTCWPPAQPTVRTRTRPAAPSEEGLSERELEVLRLLATELSGPEIAAQLFVSVNTLRTHTKHIFTKLDVNTRRPPSAARAGRARACSEATVGITKPVTSHGDVRSPRRFLGSWTSPDTARPTRTRSRHDRHHHRPDQGRRRRRRAAGAIFIGVQIGHPPAEPHHRSPRPTWLVRDCFKVLMAALALAGITGMYLSQVRRNGVLGLVGYLVFAAGYLASCAPTFIAAVVAADPRRHRTRASSRTSSPWPPAAAP